MTILYVTIKESFGKLYESICLHFEIDCEIERPTSAGERKRGRTNPSIGITYISGKQVIGVSFDPRAKVISADRCRLRERMLCIIFFIFSTGPIIYRIYK
jgi:hypothetical protein